MGEKEKVKHLLVVDKLPTQELSEVSDDKGNVYECVTLNEAIKEMLETLREIKAKM